MFEVAFHTSRFKLKHAGRIAVLEKFVSFRVIERDGINFDILVVDSLNDAQGIFDNGQVRQAQEIHFKQTNVFNRSHRILGRNNAFLGHFQRREFDDFIGCNHHTGSVDAVRTYRTL